MQQYIQGVLDEAPSDMDRVANMPASAHLFQVNPSALKLSPQSGELFITWWLCCCFCANGLGLILLHYGQIKNNEVHMESCPTDQMVSDFFMKPP